MLRMKLGKKRERGGEVEKLIDVGGYGMESYGNPLDLDLDLIEQRVREKRKEDQSQFLECIFLFPYPFLVLD